MPPAQAVDTNQQPQAAFPAGARPMASGFISAEQPTVMSTSSSTDQRQQRAWRRTPHRVPCRLSWYDEAAQRCLACVGQTIDISAGGLAVQLHREIPVGTSVEALLPNLTGEPAFLEGVVVRCQRVLAGMYQIGIRCQQARRP
jgi:hypothetical protein